LGFGLWGVSGLRFKGYGLGVLGFRVASSSATSQSGSRYPTRWMQARTRTRTHLSDWQPELPDPTPGSEDGLVAPIAPVAPAAPVAPTARQRC
jgi:hypothetical protein